MLSTNFVYSLFPLWTSEVPYLVLLCTLLLVPEITAFDQTNIQQKSNSYRISATMSDPTNCRRSVFSTNSGQKVNCNLQNWPLILVEKFSGIWKALGFQWWLYFIKPQFFLES